MLFNDVNPDKYHLPPNNNKTRHQNFHRKFSRRAEYLIRSIRVGQKLTCRLKSVHRPFRDAYLRTMIRLNSKPFFT